MLYSPDWFEANKPAELMVAEFCKLEADRTDDGEH